MARELVRGDPLAQTQISVGIRDSDTPQSRERWFVNAAVERFLVRYARRFAMIMGNGSHSRVWAAWTSL